MPNEPAWLCAEDVVRINRRIVSQTGEPHQIRDFGLLEGAIGRAQNMFVYAEEADIADMAVAIMLGVARNHPFTQGNKRTGFVAAQLFMEWNGWKLTIFDRPEFGDAIIEAIGSPENDADLARLIRLMSKPIEDDGAT